MDDNYNEHIENIEENFNFDDIGKEYKTQEGNMMNFMAIPIVEHKHRVINLYKYEPKIGQAPIIANSRKFCKQLYLRTQSKNNYLTYAELIMLNNPGSQYGVTDIMRYRGNFSTDANYNTCRHRFIRFKYDKETGNIVKDTTQPTHT